MTKTSARNFINGTTQKRMKIREIQIYDYEQLVPFWKENYFVGEMDAINRFALFLQKNPSLSFLIEDNEKIIGTALGSYDGRRGYLQKVVVDKNYRKQGIGKQLVDEVLKKLKSIGAIYVPIAVEEDLVNFYENSGFNKTTQASMSTDLL